MFREVSQNRIFQDVVEQIQDAILDGRLNKGDTLPPERELKEMFNTSRGTLREALRVLEERGLIQIKLGVRGGARVQKVSSRHASRTLGLLIRSRQIDLNHLAEFREGIEGSVASLAAQRATADDIEQLESLLEEATQCVAQGTAGRRAFWDVDRRFHSQLAHISGNPVYQLVLRSVHDNIHRYYDRYLSADESELSENLEDMDEMVHAVAEGQADTARLLAQSHVLRFVRRMKARVNADGIREE
jgi:DNA-binding FadR family transcriptional regulator